MLRVLKRPFWWRLAMVIACAMFVLTGCDTENRTAIEDGVIDASTSFVGALLQAWIEVAAAHAS